MDNQEQADKLQQEDFSTDAPKLSVKRYTWFYVGVLFMALLGNNSLEMQNMPSEVKWLVIAIAAAYCIALPKFMKLGLAIGVTMLLAVAGLAATTFFSHLKGIDPKTLLFTRSVVYGRGIDPKTLLFARSVGYGSLFFKTAAMLMWIGLIFHGISRLFTKKRVPK